MLRTAALHSVLTFAMCTPVEAADGVSIVSGSLWPDDHGVHINAHGGGVLLHDGIYYWFGEHKIAGAAGNFAHVGVHVYASRDLGHWEDRGIALSVSDDPANELAKGCIIERPKVIYNERTRTFAMWFHLEFRTDDPKKTYVTARTAVAVSARPEGPYTFVRSFRPNAGRWPVQAQDHGAPLPTAKDSAFAADRFLRRDFAGGQMARDMGLFVDDDRTAYLIASSEENSTLHISSLTDDYQDFTGTWARVLPGGWNEAPTLFKRRGIYYLIASACTGWTPNAARSARAPSIWGPWQELGNPCRGEKQDTDTTFGGQGTFVLPLPGSPDDFLFMADQWRPTNAIDGRYLWLPITWEGDKPTLRWQAEWRLPAAWLAGRP